eukprot:SAG31_NODE_13120_length_891_cov_1.255051_1_plen_225_part_00
MMAAEAAVAAAILFIISCVGGASGTCTAASAAADAVAQTANDVCGGASAEQALRSVGVPANEAARTAQALATLGLRTALDLRLLGGGAEAEELLLELQRLQTEQVVSLGGRAKLRLLMVGGPQLPMFDDHLTDDANAVSGGVLQMTADVPALTMTRRHLQSVDSVSLDTLAIVFSVLIGAAGYLVQGGLFPRHVNPRLQCACNIEVIFVLPCDSIHCAAGSSRC